MSFAEFLADCEQQEAKRHAGATFESRPASSTSISLCSADSQQRSQQADPLLLMISLQNKLKEQPPKRQEMPLLRKVLLEESYRHVRRTEVRT